MSSGIRVRDLGSHNGTYLGQARIGDAVVPDGSELVLGGTTIRVSLTGPCDVLRSRATSFGPLVGMAPTMREMFATLERVSRSDLPVLVEGEAGTGKETVARAIVSAGALATEPLTLVDCATLPSHLAEDALVGPSGLLVRAAGGTLLLEDVERLAPAVQGALVRALRTTPPRLVATTRDDLRLRVNQGTFREDLYALLAQVRVRVPALADRREDIKPLVQHFLALIPRDVHAARTIDTDVLEAIAAQSFPANVRELRTLVERVAKLADGPTIRMADLDFARVLAGEHERTDRDLEDDEPLEPFKDAKRTIVEEFERSYLAKLLARTGKNISRASALAGIERQSLRGLLRRHGLEGD